MKKVSPIVVVHSLVWSLLVLFTLQVHAKPSPYVNNFIMHVTESHEQWTNLAPDFVNLGEDQIFEITDPDNKVPKFIISARADHPMNHAQATEFCTLRGGHLPSKRQFNALVRAIRNGTTDPYNRNVIPSLWEVRTHWASTSYDSGYSVVFYGYNGLTGGQDNFVPSAVRCVQDSLPSSFQ